MISFEQKNNESRRFFTGNESEIWGGGSVWCKIQYINACGTLVKKWPDLP